MQPVRFRTLMLDTEVLAEPMVDVISDNPEHGRFSGWTPRTPRCVNFQIEVKDCQWHAAEGGA